MLSVIIPTYNERENLPIVVQRIFEVFEKENINGEVIVVDDNSPDGTAEIAQKLKDKYNLQVMVRKDKRGLSSAVLDAFKIASRYIKGGDIKNWPLKRRIISRGASLLSYFLTRIKDPLS